MSKLRLVTPALACLMGLLISACGHAGPPTHPEVPTHASSTGLLSAETVRVSEHVWAILGWPNVGIIVGAQTTLVVDTGLGRRNGVLVAAVAKGLAPTNRLVVTTTHFHPEHASGILGFPIGTQLIRPRAQQEEMDQHGEEMIRLFSTMNERWAALLHGEQLRESDETFERERRLDLGGGVAARLLWFGAAHTLGDEVVFVEPDKTLISGDVVQNRVGPRIFGAGGTAASWIAAVEECARLGPVHILPDHSAVGNGSLVEQERAFLVALRERARTNQRAGVSAADAGRALTVEFRRDFPEWDIDDLTTFVEAAYRE